jgi:hypothetical protein
MIPSRPDMTAATAKNLMLALAGEGSLVHRRMATIYCTENGIKVSELRDLARQVTDLGPRVAGLVKK